MQRTVALVERPEDDQLPDGAVHCGVGRQAAGLTHQLAEHTVLVCSNRQRSTRQREYGHRLLSRCGTGQSLSLTHAWTLC